MSYGNLNDKLVLRDFWPLRALTAPTTRSARVALQGILPSPTPGTGGGSLLPSLTEI